MARRQILLCVEDTESDVALMRTVVAEGNLAMEVKSVQDGGELVRYMKGEGKFTDRVLFPVPSLVLLDLKMPNTDGFQVLQWLRQQAGFKRLVVIVLTASGRQADVDRSHDLGANAVFVKPSTLDEFVHLLEQVCVWMELTPP